MLERRKAQKAARIARKLAKRVWKEAALDSDLLGEFEYVAAATKDADIHGLEIISYKVGDFEIDLYNKISGADYDEIMESCTISIVGNTIVNGQLKDPGEPPFRKRLSLMSILLKYRLCRLMNKLATKKPDYGIQWSFVIEEWGSVFGSTCYQVRNKLIDFMSHASQREIFINKLIQEIKIKIGIW